MIQAAPVLAARALNLVHLRCCLAAWETACRLQVLSLEPPTTGTIAPQSKERFNSQSTKSYHDISHI